MPESQCKVYLILSEQESLALKTLIQSIQAKEIEKYGLSTGQLELLNGVDKVLPDWFRAYNSDEELNNAEVPD